MYTKRGILIFNQAQLDLSLVSALLEAEDCTVYITSLPLEAIHILRKNEIDVILASSHLEGMEGTEFKELAESIKPGVSIFLLPMHEHPGSTPDACECIVNIKEFVHFIRNHIKTEALLMHKATKFKEFFFSFTDRLMQLFEVNNKYFFNNDHLVADISRKIATRMNVEEPLVDTILLSALLRDIGKIWIQQEILNEKTPLGQDAFISIKAHPLNSVQLLKNINFPWNVESIIRHHHEHYDGNGYPDGLIGRNIPLGSRIIAVADSYVAMTSHRSYRKKLTRTEATNEILKMAGSQFDPEVVEVFFSVLQQDQAGAPESKLLLVLDRDEATAAYLQLNLDSEEYDVYPVHTATAALAFLEETKPYVIIADMETMTADRVNLYVEIRHNFSTYTIPLIVLGNKGTHPRQYSDPLVLFNPKPVDLALLTATIDSLYSRERSDTRIPASEGALTGVSGCLAEMELTDIIQVLNMGLKTARVILNKDEEKGEIYLKSGKIINARAGNLAGQDAFYHLIGWNDGIFRIFHGQTTEDVNITIDTLTLLLDASRVLDETRFNKNTREPNGNFVALPPE
jgi:response regulator RpfG family c-di-GMP phosphodiesterase